MIAFNPNSSALNRSHPLNKGLVGAWMPSLGATAQVLRDISGNHNHGTLTNGPRWVPAARPGSKLALGFDASDDFIDINNPNAPLLPATSNWTIAFWAKPESSGPDTVFAQYIASVGNGRIIFRFSTFSRWNVFLGDDGALPSVDLQGPDAVALNNWYHVVFTREGNTFRVYVDTVLRATQTDSGTRNILQAGNLLGARSDHNSSYNATVADHFDGQLGELQIYGRALASSEIWSLYQESRRGYPGLLPLSANAARASVGPVASADNESSSSSISSASSASSSSQSSSSQSSTSTSSSSSQGIVDYVDSSTITATGPALSSITATGPALSSYVDP